MRGWGDGNGADRGEYSSGQTRRRSSVLALPLRGRGTLVGDLLAGGDGWPRPGHVPCRYPGVVARRIPVPRRSWRRPGRVVWRRGGFHLLGREGVGRSENREPIPQGRIEGLHRRGWRVFLGQLLPIVHDLGRSRAD